MANTFGDISKSFSTVNDTVSKIFSEMGVAFYIPLYQRAYTWDEENIDQFMEDICQGVERMVDDDNEIRFLGTIIRITENDRANINPQDNRAIPSRVENIIDGQQRMSTIAMLAALLYQRLQAICNKLPNSEPFATVRNEVVRAKLDALYNLFSFDLGRGTPRRKPVIIRGSVDGWTYDGDDKEHYKSSVAAYLASVIRTINDGGKFPDLPKEPYVGDNLKCMNRWLVKIEESHKETSADDMDFPPAWRIVDSEKLQLYIWDYKRGELQTIISDKANINSERNDLCRLVQLLAFTYYLLERCCFNVINPASDEWAFDMFQSLNATGTALTAIETFKPMVVNKTNLEDGGFKASATEKYFTQVEALFDQENNSAKKAKLTDEFLTTFAHTVDGKKLSRRFSAQRHWLSDQYSNGKDKQEREESIRRMADVATYLKNVIQYIDNSSSLPLLNEIDQFDRELATTCVLYLNDASHKMAHTILSLFYSKVIRSLPNAQQEFVSACKATAAFYTLWRSAYSNSGLDDAYRSILRGMKDNDGNDIKPVSWLNYDFSAALLKSYYSRLLKDRKDITTFDSWFRRAKVNLRFDIAKFVSRFALFMVSQDTMPDNSSPGLMKSARLGSTIKFLSPTLWNGSDYRSIEHVAPQKRPQVSTWDENLYVDEKYHSIGNLTLLPVELNSSASNKDWKAKWIYYKHLSEQDPDQLLHLNALATRYEVQIDANVVEMLERVTHKSYMQPIISVPIDGSWNTVIVEARTQRICEILWERLDKWLT